MPGHLSPPIFRPRGLELAAGEVAARAIALMAKGRPVDELKVSME